ncbi:MAG: cation transporter [Rikenellaceae bacterium]
MKKIILMVIAMVMTAGIAEISAATKVKDVTIETSKFMTDIDCEHCVTKVMNYMPTQKGIKDVEVDLPKKVITISYDSEKTSTKSIIKLFKKIDITATLLEEKGQAQSVATPAVSTQTTNNSKTTTTTNNNTSTNKQR